MSDPFSYEDESFIRRRLLEVPKECEKMTSIFLKCIYHPETFLKEQKDLNPEAEDTSVSDWLPVLLNDHVREKLLQNLRLVERISQRVLVPNIMRHSRKGVHAFIRKIVFRGVCFCFLGNS